MIQFWDAGLGFFFIMLGCDLLFRNKNYKLFEININIRKGEIK